MHTAGKAGTGRLRYLVARFAGAIVRRPWAVFRGPGGIRRWVRRTLAERYAPPLDEQYQAWLERHTLTPQRRRRMGRECEGLAYRPLISIVTPVYNTPEAWLRRAIDSVRAQIYPHWQLCLADDASSEAHVWPVVEEYCGLDSRIEAARASERQGIADASNTALSLARGEFAGFLDHDDELRPEALLEVVKLLNKAPSLDIIYTDEDKKTQGGRLVSPFFKPDWSPNLLLSCNYVTHFSVYRRSLLEDLDGLRMGFDGSQDYDLILRASEKTSRIGHVPLPLYSWRMAAGSAAGSERAKPYAYKAAIRALSEAVERRGWPGRVEGTEVPGRYRVRLALPPGALVSIIVPTRDKAGLLRRCLRSLKSHAGYSNYEVVVVDSAPDEPLAEELRSQVAALVPCDGDRFNFSRAINLGAQRARGDYLLLLNDDTEVLRKGWLEAMLEHAQRPEVGVVGARLLDGQGEPQHEGIVLGMRGQPAANIGFRYLALGDCLRDCSAVTAACLMTRRAVFEELGGFDEELRLAWNDVDYCLRARRAGYAVVYTPFAVLRHHERSTRADQDHSDDDAYFRQRWGPPAGLHDPYYNRNFDRDRGPFILEG